MNEAQIHLALNHAPLLLSIVGGGILILGLLKKNESFKSLALFMLIAAALFAIPVFLTGEGTEELVEHLPGVNKTAIETHEDMAKLSLIIIVIGGVLALAMLFLKRFKQVAGFLFAAIVILSLASFVTMAITAHNGGKIRHAETQDMAINSLNRNEGEDKEENESKIKNDVTPIQQAVGDSTQIKGKEKDEDDDD